MMNNLLNSKRRLDSINNSSLVGSRFEDRYRRITLYLENDIYADLQLLRGPGMSQSSIVNAALKQFFKSNHSETTSQS